MILTEMTPMDFAPVAADIAERDGDKETALAGYRRLINSSLAMTARTRAADVERGKALILFLGAPRWDGGGTEY